MFVLPQARRRGIGQRLLTAVEDAARGYDGRMCNLWFGETLG
jgi:GNAT superfamily N-acetyltransferase